MIKVIDNIVRIIIVILLLILILITFKLSGNSNNFDKVKKNKPTNLNDNMP